MEYVARVCFKPQRAASSIPTPVILLLLARSDFCFKPQRAASSIPTRHAVLSSSRISRFQTPTGRLIHSNRSNDARNTPSVPVSNPNGPPHPFQPYLRCCSAPDRTGFKPQRAASSIPTGDCAYPALWIRGVSNPNGPPHPFQH